MKKNAKHYCPKLKEKLYTQVVERYEKGESIPSIYRDLKPEYSIFTFYAWVRFKKPMHSKNGIPKSLQKTLIFNKMLAYLESNKATTITNLSRKFDLSYGIVYNWLKKNNLLDRFSKAHKRNFVEKNIIKAFEKNPHISISEISKIYGVSCSFVYQIVRKLKKETGILNTSLESENETTVHPLSCDFHEESEPNELSSMEL